MSKEQLEANMDSRICNPARHRKPGETCLSLEALERIQQAWNKTHENAPITLPNSEKKINTVTRRKSLWRQIREGMKNYYDCDTEFCVVKKAPGLDKKTKNTMTKKYFRPEKPDEWLKKETTWLDSFNIEDVMNQYEEGYPDFEFIGPVPIDFAAPMTQTPFFTQDSQTVGQCIVDELCKLEAKVALKKGTKRIGIIFNLDKHDEPGTHWVCAFVDYPKKSAYYFDSYGIPPPPEVARFLEKCKEQGCLTILYNDIRHQRKDSECGMYCLYVIICLLKGRTFQATCTDIVKDDTINAFRDVLFATEKPRREALNKIVQNLCA